MSAREFIRGSKLGMSPEFLKEETDEEFEASLRLENDDHPLEEIVALAVELAEKRRLRRAALVA
ncbi:MAG: hypothetical protein HQL51_01290 [Magnetococcales bacterium]|nr:hypothetical protein [Magnetococcales bacterium]